MKKESEKKQRKNKQRELFEILKEKQNHEEELGGGRPKNKKTKTTLKTDEGTKLSANQNITTKKRTQRGRL